MKYNISLLMTLILSTLLTAESSLAYDSFSNKKRMFSDSDTINLCETMKVKGSNRHARYMDILIEKSGITKEQWNKHYAFTVYCTGNMPLFYALKWQLEDFKNLADYGVDLNHFIEDEDGDVSTVKDYVKYKFRSVPKNERSKWRKIYKVIKSKGAKGCKEQPELKCTAPYINWVPPSK